MWTRDGRRIVFSRAGQGLFWAEEGTGAAERLTESTALPTPMAFSRDGAHLLVGDGPDPQTEQIKMLSLEGKRAVDLVTQPRVRVRNGDISPDGRWLAYQSDESGVFEIYVRPFPDIQSGRWQVSRSGGTRPIWAQNGREIYYLVSAPNRPLTIAQLDPSSRSWWCPSKLGPLFRAGNPAKLFEGPYFAAVERPHLRCLARRPTISDDRTQDHRSGGDYEPPHHCCRKLLRGTEAARAPTR